MPLGYEVTIFEKFDKPGGLMRTNIPSFRLPEHVLMEEIDKILNMGVDIRYNSPVESMKTLLAESFDAMFIGSGAPRGKESRTPRPARSATASTSASTGSARSLSGTPTKSANAC